jgi:hypothetical protein
MKRGHHRGEVDLFVRPGRHAPLRAMAAGWLAPVVAALLVVGAVVAWGIVSARDPVGASSARGTAVPSKLLLLELRSEDAVMIALVGSSGTLPPAALTIPPNVVMTIPGQGDGTVKDVTLLHGSEATVAISNLVGAWIPHYAVTDPSHLAAVVDRAGGIQLFGSVTSGAEVAAALEEPGPARGLTWRETLIGLFQARSAWTPSDFVGSDDAAAGARLLTAARGAAMEALPTVNVTPGYLRPDYEAVAAFMRNRFGMAGQPPIRVLVLNGSGAPGVGESVAKRLIPEGYRVVVSENASSFDHGETLVVAASEEFREAAERVRKLLGVGALSVSAVPSGLGEVTILVGEDYTNG